MGLARAAPGRTKAAGATHNVARAERVGSVAIGAALVTYGLRRRDPAGAVAALIGSAFVVRGATRHCPVYRAMGGSTGSADAVLLAPRPDVTSRAAILDAPPAGKLGVAIAKLFGEDPDHEVMDDLRRLKRLMERGEITA